MLKFIWCQTGNKGIAKDQKIPWYVKKQHDAFINEIKGHIVVYGQYLFANFLGSKTIPEADNIIYSSTIQPSADGSYKVINEQKPILKWAEKQDVFVIGGTKIFNIFVDYVQELIVYELKNYYDCNRFMDIDFGKFHLTSEVDEGEYYLKKYIRISK
ncbi:dihydrofolate reductase [Ureaplasma sp. ES3154-GEN]|uniref:dihydrofolate reductase n=1 Tax=Ureaplasma sp. ES3154-GEN TaxID=2984844 RepID=UPI0021E98D15|nr:dihydrofolate reductase [Ureaplasma sp. ES3154-GEN]MCV3743374.1 dihydrofolate reductase [Ureaplasma sp. ES3154-GEN]